MLAIILCFNTKYFSELQKNKGVLSDQSKKKKNETKLTANIICHVLVNWMKLTLFFTVFDNMKNFSIFKGSPISVDLHVCVNNHNLLNTQWFTVMSFLNPFWQSTELLP